METQPIRPDTNRMLTLREKAKDLEAAFLAEMLGHAGLSRSDGAFSGGQGEEQFASFLRQAQAEALVEKGGVGLAEMIFKSLSAPEGFEND